MSKEDIEIQNNEIQRVQKIKYNNNIKRPWGIAPFLILSWFSCFILGLFLVGIYYLSVPRILQISTSIVYAFAIILAILFFIPSGGLFLITMTSITGLDLLYPHGKKQVTMLVLPPIVFMIGTRIFKIEKDRLRESFIAVSNKLFLAQIEKGRFSAKRLLILLPHCLQNHKCPWKITWSIENCKQCGLCPLGALVAMHHKNDIYVYVATGGTIARRVVKEANPTMILAVACPRDLAEGMVDVYPIPVFGILLDRPKGPCFDTHLKLYDVFDFLKRFRPEVYKEMIDQINELASKYERNYN